MIVMTLMLLTVAWRTLAYKVFFQLDFGDPLFVTVLTSFSQALALPLYFLLQCCFGFSTYSSSSEHKEKAHDVEDDECSETESSGDYDDDDDDDDLENAIPLGDDGENEDREIPHDSPPPPSSRHADPLNLRASFQRTTAYRSLRQVFLDDLLNESKWQPAILEDQSESAALTEANLKMSSVLSMRSTFNKRESSRFAVTGEDERHPIEVTTESDENQIHWANRIPKYARPVAGSVLRLIGGICTILSIYYMPASLAALGIRGGELIVAILAQKFIRKRTVTLQQWLGAFIVTMGLAVVLCSEIVGQKGTIGSTANIPLGMMSALGRAVMQVACDMVGEIFMKETAFPPCLLLGLEGLYGLLVAMPLYAVLSPVFGFKPAEAFAEAFAAANYSLFLVMLIFAILISWVFSVVSVAQTSVVTRNMFSGLLGLVVWVFEVIIFYSSQNEDDKALGEPWSIPGSPMLLAGFAVIMGGLYTYSFKRDAPEAN